MQIKVSNLEEVFSYLLRESVRYNPVQKFLIISYHLLLTKEAASMSKQIQERKAS